MKKVLLNSSQMSLMAISYIKELFPKPYENDLITSSGFIYVNGKDCCNFYFEDNYYEKLVTHIKRECEMGKFAKSNSEERWLDLMNTIYNAKEIQNIEESTTMYYNSLDRPKIENSVKKIIIERETRGNGMFSVSDEIWNVFLNIESGTFLESDNEYIITTNDYLEISFPKTSSLIHSRMYNRYINADLGLFYLFESKNSRYGIFVLYIPKDKKLENKPIIASIGGIMGGSSVWLRLVKSI